MSCLQCRVTFQLPESLQGTHPAARGVSQGAGGCAAESPRPGTGGGGGGKTECPLQELVFRNTQTPHMAGNGVPPCLCLVCHRPRLGLRTAPQSKLRRSVGAFQTEEDGPDVSGQPRVVPAAGRWSCVPRGCRSPGRRAHVSSFLSERRKEPAMTFGDTWAPTWAYAVTAESDTAAGLSRA